MQQTQPWRNRRDLLSSHSHHLQLSRALICTLWISVYPLDPAGMVGEVAGMVGEEPWGSWEGGVAGRPSLLLFPPQSTGGARSPAEGREPTRDREVGGAALRCDQSPQLPARIGPRWPVVPGGRASVPSSCEGLGSPVRFLSPGEGRSPLGREGPQGLGSGSPFLRPGSPRRPSPGAAWSPLEVPSRRLQIMH